MEEWVPGEEKVCSKMVHKMLIANYGIITHRQLKNQ